MGIEMKIVLLESLGITEEKLAVFADKLKEAGHQFAAYEKNTDPDVCIERAKDADVIMYNSTIDGELHTIDELLT